MIRWLLVAVGGLIAVIAAVWLIGTGIRQDHRATASRELPIRVDQVWKRITDLDDFARWRPDVDTVELIQRPSNLLPAWRERGSGGVLAIEATVVEPLTRLVFEIIDEGQPFGGSWTYLLEPADSGTRLTITEDGEIYHPIFRFVAKYVLGYDGTINRYLDALEADVVATTGPCAGSPGTPLAKKLGIKPGHIVGTFHAPPHVGDLLGDIPDGARIEADPGEDQVLDVALLFVTDTASLNAEFPTIATRLRPDGGLWVAWPKQGSSLATDLKRDQVRMIGLGHRLVDNKVCAIDEDWSGLRFVYRLKDR